MDLTEQQQDTLLWKTKMMRLVIHQFLFVLVFGGGLLFWWNWRIFGSFILGGVLISLNTLVMAKVFSATEVSQKSIYRSAVFRYVGIFLALFFLAAIGMNLLAVCGGMFIAYLAGFVSSAKGVFNQRK